MSHSRQDSVEMALQLVPSALAERFVYDQRKYAFRERIYREEGIIRTGDGLTEESFAYLCSVDCYLILQASISIAIPPEAYPNFLY